MKEETCDHPTNLRMGPQMLNEAEVKTILAMAEKGHSKASIARVIGCSRPTVDRYIAQGEWQPSAKLGQSRLQGLDDWLHERLLRHGGNADVVRQDLQSELGVCVSLRSVERAVADFRREQAAATQATVRFETPPGHQLQIDFGEKRVAIQSKLEKVCVFVATLGYSRRCFALAFAHHQQPAWLEGLEASFRHFGGVPAEVLMDNESALVKRARTASRAAVFQDRLLAFARYWGFVPRACLAHRAQTKGKDENGVKFVKRNALAGHAFSSLAAVNAHLQQWLRNVADQRVHGTTRMTPLARFAEEASHLAPIHGRPPFAAGADIVRKVAKDCVIQWDSNAYSVPWQLVGCHVRVEVAADEIRIYSGTELQAIHARCTGRHQRRVDPAHFEGLKRRAEAPDEPSELSRPLAAYADVAGGEF